MTNANSKPSNEVPVKGIPFYSDALGRYILLQENDARLLQDWRTRERYFRPE
jgi:hypothetical protein